MLSENIALLEDIYGRWSQEAIMQEPDAMARVRQS